MSLEKTPMKHITIIIGISLILLIGCSVHDSKKQPAFLRGLDNLRKYAKNIRVDSMYLSRRQVFGSDEAVIIGRIGAITVDQLGRVYIADIGKEIIDVFQPDTHYLTSIGKEGKGPGEFMSIGNMKIKFHKLYVFDVKLQKLSAFSLDSLHPIAEWSIKPLNKTMSSGQFYVKRDNRFLIGFEDFDPPNAKRYIHFYIVDKSGLHPGDEILKKRIKHIFHLNYNGKMLAGTTPGSRTTLFAANKNYIFAAWSAHFLIKVYDWEGTYKQAYYYSFQNQLFNKENTISKYPKRLQKAIRKLSFPQTQPALQNMLIDDQNRLWVATIVKDQSVYQWWILSEKGKPLARFTWPRAKSIKVVKKGYVYTVEMNKQSKIKHVVRYNMQMQ